MVRRRADAYGYLLIVALFVILVAMSAALLVSASIHRQSRAYLRERQQVELTAMTDAALALALSSLSVDTDFTGATRSFGPTGGSRGRDVGAGTIEIEVRADPLDDPKVRLVVVRAAFGASGRAAQARVCVKPDPSPNEELCDGRRRPWVIEWEPIPYL